MCLFFWFLFVFFFKQKTAYEMRISDWSSDVCSSDHPPVVARSGYCAPDRSGCNSSGVDMILAVVLALAAQANPEAEIVMDRKRREAAETRNAETKTLSKPAFTQRPEMQQKFNACLDAAIDSPEAGAKWAEQWRIAGGGYLARQCLGFAYAEQKRWLPAMTAFQQVAEIGRAHV